MGAAREGPAFDERKTHARVGFRRPASTEALERLEFRHADFAAAPLEHPHAAGLPFVLAQRQLDREGIRQHSGRVAHRRDHLHRPIGRQHGREGVIGLGHGLGLKLAAHKIEGRLRLRAQQEPARIGVQAVDIGDAVAIARVRMDEAHQVFARLVPAVRGHEETARFVEGDERVVLKNDRRKRHGLLHLVGFSIRKSSPKSRRPAGRSG